MKIAFYTCFFGADSNERNRIPICPSKTHCFFFTNNPNTYIRLENTNWNRIYVNIPIKNNLTADAMDAKHLKACPYMYPELNGYDATCYFDSVLTVNTNEIVEFANKIFTYSNYDMFIARHPFISATWPPSVKSEFNEAMLQPRYAAEREIWEIYGGTDSVGTFGNRRYPLCNWFHCEKKQHGNAEVRRSVVSTHFGVRNRMPDQFFLCPTDVQRKNLWDRAVFVLQVGKPTVSPTTPSLHFNI